MLSVVARIKRNKFQLHRNKSPNDLTYGARHARYHRNLSNPALTVEMISTEVGISRVHLHRKLKELTNQTTQQLIRNLRLKQAATLLAEKRHSITEIATLTGFTHPTYFARHSVKCLVYPHQNIWNSI